MKKGLRKWLAVCAIPVLMGACATGSKSGRRDSADPSIPAPKDINDVVDGSDRSRSGLGLSGLRNPGTIYIQGKKLKNTEFDIPIAINSAVEDWVDYFTGRGRGYFEKYLERSEFFIPYIEPILKENGMPLDMVYLAMIESGFNNLARSHAKAVGPWQFMPATGKRYGLDVNWWIDERRDIRKSTLAAVEYLRDLYNMFHSWELAAASYNAGEFKVARAIQRYGTKDFWALTRHRYLKAETRNYVPKMMAAALISKNREQFGFKASRLNTGSDEIVAGDGEVVKVVKTDEPLEKGKDRLTEVLATDLPENASPEEKKQIAEQAMQKLGEDSDFEDDDDAETEDATKVAESVKPSVSPKQPLARIIPTPHLSKEGNIGGENLVEFDIKSPADLLKIARAAGLSYQTVKSLNPELLRWCTPPSAAATSYRIKLPVSVKEKFLAAYNHPAFPRQVDFLTYTARSGESLSRVARYFGIKVDPIAELNRISPRASLRRGMKIILPIPNDRSRSIASLEVRDPPEKRRHRSKRGGAKSFKRGRSSSSADAIRATSASAAHKPSVSAKKRAAARQGR